MVAGYAGIPCDPLINTYQNLALYSIAALWGIMGDMVKSDFKGVICESFYLRLHHYKKLKIISPLPVVVLISQHSYVGS